MARSDPDFATRVLQLMLAYARDQGVDIKPLFETYRIPKDVNLDQPGKDELLTKVSTMRALSEALATELHDDHLGLSLAKARPRGSYGVAEFLVRSVPTLRDAWVNFVRFNALFAPRQTFRFDETATEAELHHYATTQPGALGRHLHEYTTAAMAESIRSMADGVEFTRVWFCNSKPASTDALTAYFQAPMEFDRPTNGLAMPRSLLDKPVKSGDPALFLFLEEHAVAALASAPKVDELIDQLRRSLKDALKTGEPNIERLSVKMNMSARTLQRRLSELHTTFQDVLDGVRYDLARVFLRDERLDISQVAYLLGYSELRALDRAFKRWSGISPREWRQKPPS